MHKINKIVGNTIETTASDRLKIIISEDAPPKLVVNNIKIQLTKEETHIMRTAFMSYQRAKDIQLLQSFLDITGDQDA